MTENKYAATGWSSAPVLEDVELPSGQLCQVQKISMERIIMLGLVDALDSFQGAMAAVKEKKAKGKKKSAAEEDNEFMIELFRDPEKFAGLMQTVDKCVVEIVVQPQLNANPAEGKPRKDDLIYVDSVDFQDKMVLFGRVMEEVGGVEDFRQRSENHLGAVAEKPGHENDSVASGGNTV